MPVSRTELKNLHALSSRKGRLRQGRFLAEGVRLLEEAVRHDVRPIAVYHAPSMLSERGTELVEQFRSRRVACEVLPAKELHRLADTRTPQGVVGLFALPETDLQQLYGPQFRSILVCDRIADPGNLGTLLRSALAFDFDLVILVGNCAEPYAPKVVRSSVGAVFGLRIARADYAALGRLIDSSGAMLMAASAAEGTREWRAQVASQPQRMLAIGSEAEGLSSEVDALTTVRVHIAHSGNVESLNAAVAGSILMKEIYDVAG